MNDPNQRPRITLVASSLSAGGAERVLSSMANHWAGQGRAVTLLTLAPTGSDFFALDPRITRVGLGRTGVSSSALRGGLANFQRLRALRRAVVASKPDAVISFVDQTNVLTLIACLGTGLPVIVSERTNPKVHVIGATWARLRGLVYPWADAVVVQTEANALWARDFVRADRVHVVPNPIAPEVVGLSAVAPSERSTRRVLALGRVSTLKGSDLLVRAFAEAARNAPDWELVIAGDGTDRERILELAAELGIVDRVRLPGLVHDPWRTLAPIDVFVHPSRYEGMSNAILEAMACGVPVITATTAAGGDLGIADGSTGLVVSLEDHVDLARALGRLIASAPLRHALASAARTHTARFEIGAVMAQWDALLDRVGAGRARS